MKTFFKTMALVALLTGGRSLYAGDPDPQYDASNPTYNTQVDITAFGATGNDTSDDTSAINSAIAALGAEGGTVFVPKGTYYLSASTTFSHPAGGTMYVAINIQGKRNVRLVGQGASSRLRVPTGTGNYGGSDVCLVGIINSTNCEVKDLRITGANKNWDGETSIRAGSAIYVHNSARTRAHGNYLEDASSGIGAEISPWCKYTDNHITGHISQAGIQLYKYGTGSTDHNVITGNTIDGGDDSAISMGIWVDSKYTTIGFNAIRNCWAEAIPVEGNLSEYLTIVGNTIESTYGEGVSLRHASRVVVAGNALGGSGIWSLAGMFSSHSSTNDFSSTNNVINGNVIKSASHGIYIMPQNVGSIGGQSIVANNMIEAVDTGIKFDDDGGGNRQNTVIGNRIMNAGGNGIYITTPDHLLEGNYILKGTYHGIYADTAATNLVINGNYLTGANNSSTVGIFLNLTSPNSSVADNEVRDWNYQYYIGGDSFSLTTPTTFRLRPVPWSPVTGAKGTIFMDDGTVNNKLNISDGTSWYAAW